MNITVAGAGAGKTTSMAHKVLERFDDRRNNKCIYVVTYTNAARNKIRELVENHRGAVPDRLFIETIHAFLLREFIFPFHHLIYDTYYTHISEIPLDPNPKYKKSKLKELERNQILHVSEVTRKARWMVNNKSSDRKKEREKKEKVKSILTNYIDSIFVDEAQDMDEHFMKLLIEMNGYVQVDLVGDPKQDLRGHHAFRELIDCFPQNVIYKSHNRRCPSNHIKLANNFISKEENQKSFLEKDGILNFAFESDYLGEIHTFINEYDYIYIKNKNARFNTHSFDKNKTDSTLEYELELLLKNSGISEREIKPTIYTLIKRIKIIINDKENFEIINILKNHYKLTLGRIEYGRLCTALDLLRLKPNLSGIPVYSIDRVKGLEGDRCLFILTPDMAKYLFREMQEENKMLNYLYVALTRAKQTLSILITIEVEENYGEERIKEEFERLDITESV